MDKSLNNGYSMVIQWLFINGKYMGYFSWLSVIPWILILNVYSFMAINLKLLMVINAYEWLLVTYIPLEFRLRSLGPLEIGIYHPR